MPPKGSGRLFAALTGHGDGAGDGAGEIHAMRQAHPFAQGEADDILRGALGIVGGKKRDQRSRAGQGGAGKMA